MSFFRRVEQQLDERLRRMFSGESPQGREALEIQHAILEEIGTRVQPVGRGRHAFPWRRLEIRIAVPDPAERPLFSIAFAEGDQLASDIRECLREAGCDPPSDLEVEVALAEDPIPGGYGIVYHEKPAAPAPVAAAPPPAHLTILHGEAAQPVYPLGAARVNIGRLEDVLDDQQRLVRRNQVAFAEGTDPAASTVSRAHAHIQYDAAEGEYRLFDDHSAYGTTLFREGTLLTVPAGAGRGLALRAGDEIYFGQALARFDVD